MTTDGGELLLSLWRPICRRRLVLKLEAVVVAQLVERLLLIPDVRSSNPVISKNLY